MVLRFGILLYQLWTRHAGAITISHQQWSLRLIVVIFGQVVVLFIIQTVDRRELSVAIVHIRVMRLIPDTTCLCFPDQ